MLALPKFFVMATAASCLTSDAFDIPRLSNVQTDSQDGSPVTFDLTHSLSLADIFGTSLARLVSSPLSNKTANGYIIVGAKMIKAGSPGNALIEGAHPLQEGINQWRFVGSGGSFGCGASDSARFDSGWKMNGLYLTSNGNLAGRGALKVGYAKQIPRDPIVDWYLHVAGKQVDIYININDIPQGHAFQLTFPDVSGIKALRPLLSFLDTSDQARAAFFQFETVPFTTEGAMTYMDMPRPSLKYTTWELEGHPKATFLVTDGRATVKVANSISVPADFTGKGQVTVKGSPISTRVMPPEHLRKLESDMTQMISTLTSWRLSNDTLTLESDIGITRWYPQRASEPVMENPFVTQ